jgi:hypothetical protein
VRIRKPLLAAAIVAAGPTFGGCGDSSHAVTATGSASTANWVTHADPVTLLPQPGEVSGLIRHASATNRYDQALNGTTVNAWFGPASAAVMKLASGAAELSVVGPAGSQLYTEVFVFKRLDGAKSLASAFLRRTRLGRASQAGSGTPGERGAASSQRYGHGGISFRYAFREQNVLCLVELDGPRGHFTLSDAMTVAKAADRHITSTLS